jgi:hypothetical protein
MPYSNWNPVATTHSPKGYDIKGKGKNTKWTSDMQLFVISKLIFVTQLPSRVVKNHESSLYISATEL